MPMNIEKFLVALSKINSITPKAIHKLSSLFLSEDFQFFVKELANFSNEYNFNMKKIKSHSKKIKNEYKELSNINIISEELHNLLILLLTSSMYKDKKRRDHILTLPTNSEVIEKEAKKISKKLDSNQITEDQIKKSIKLQYNYDRIRNIFAETSIKKIIEIQSINSLYFEYLFYLEMKKNVSAETENYWKPLIEILRYTKNEFPQLFTININLEFEERKVIKTRYIDFEKSYKKIRKKLESLKQ